LKAHDTNFCRQLKVNKTLMIRIHTRRKQNGEQSLRHSRSATLVKTELYRKKKNAVSCIDDKINAYFRFFLQLNWQENAQMR
jgi:hypothetical protein